MSLELGEVVVDESVVVLPDDGVVVVVDGVVVPDDGVVVVLGVSAAG
jgi:hypothetical protein